MCKTEITSGSSANGGLELEDDRPAKLEMSATEAAQKTYAFQTSLEHGFPCARDGAESIVFFRPVDSNLSYHTFLGDSFQSSNFDVMGQVFSLVEGSGEVDAAGRLAAVTLGPPSGSACAMKLTNLPYDLLSSQLTVWDAGDIGHRARRAMFLGSQLLLRWSLVISHKQQ